MPFTVVRLACFRLGMALSTDHEKPICQNGVCEIGYESTSETVVELPYRIY